MASERLAIAVAALLAAIAVASPARAEPTAAEKETARALMADGRDRRDAGDFKRALQSFQAADAIMHVPTTGLEVARTQASLGLLVEARDTLLQVLRMPVAPNEPPPFAAARANAQSLDDELAARIPSVRVVVRGAADATVRIDDVPLPGALLGEPFKLDPGHHVVRASSGDATARQEIDVAERDAKTVTLVLARPAEAIAPPPTAEATAPVVARTDVAPRPRTMRTLTWIGLGVAGAGVVAGSISGLVSLSHTSAAKGACVDTLCGPAAHDDLATARTTATISTVSFVVAGVGAGAAIVGLLVGDRAEAAPREARVVPWVAPSPGGAAAGARVLF